MYDLHMRYLERDGRFDASDSTVRGDLLTLESSGDGTRYRIEPEALRQLDGNGQPIEGPLAEHYVLHKTSGMNMDKVKSYIEANNDRFINELFDLIRIPSISAEAARRPDMQRCAEWLAAALVKAGADRAEVMPTEGNPLSMPRRSSTGRPARSSSTAIMMSCRSIRVPSGARIPSSRLCATAASGRAAPMTTRGSCGCTPRPSRRCAPPGHSPAT